MSALSTPPQRSQERLPIWLIAEWMDYWCDVHGGKYAKEQLESVQYVAPLTTEEEKGLTLLGGSVLLRVLGTWKQILSTVRC
jgi:hypothetical protein